MKKLNLAPEYDLEANGMNGPFYCQECKVRINHWTDVCNRCYNE